ncbi:HAD family phosphatase [Waterburya agarophytonicola K14]|uniref:HAD family phosphatase n=1 Tax=Waterburya agarophytonicola KI4 TaxID=2874699 RepID=A0A964BTC1_9CYAN|nr:HAD family phosphatase [Waterburya agarophytonicola]MCC0179115.1 HAD family phosphatase [Waterburya agarophytonicola KI4]
MLEAILFDLDGTLADTDSIHFAVWQDILIRFNLDIDRAFYQQRISGRTNSKIIKDIIPQLTLEEAWKLATEKEETYRRVANSLKPTPGLDKLLRLTDDVVIKRAVVTNAPVDNAVYMLKVLHLTDTFPTVIMAKDAPPGKPDPAPYQLALSRLGMIEPAKAIAFEDSAAGIHSAVGAGIYTIGITSSHPSADLISAGANMTIKDFNSPKLWQLLNYLVTDNKAQRL